ncbi:hypothetical protein GS501_05145 [Saccharibacter sp. 17.LH.SD]|uniref:hypothetical protein n=1 Tax=Saccharibacter sp. 17.LH.SD TaxID=2689393 RepID=UPI00136BABC6|nr:hypothetical protein [Saccharibacter sp. 17.LH.SD]MXV44433.1 hypothetical protein [Saccharibacter sp. 17.LH.SD]
MLPEEIKQKNNLGTGKFLLLNLVTLSIFSLERISVMTSLIESFSGEKISSEKFKITLQVITSFYILLSGENTFNRNAFIGLLLQLLSFVLWGMFAYWSFQAKREIEIYSVKELGFSYKMNSFYTILFNVLYINYCLNDLADENMKYNYIKSQNV